MIIANFAGQSSVPKMKKAVFMKGIQQRIESIGYAELVLRIFVIASTLQ